MNKEDKIKLLVLTIDEQNFLKGIEDKSIPLVFGDTSQLDKLKRINAKLAITKEKVEEELESINDQMIELEKLKVRREELLSLLD